MITCTSVVGLVLQHCNLDFIFSYLSYLLHPIPTPPDILSSNIIHTQLSYFLTYDHAF